MGDIKVDLSKGDSKDFVPPKVILGVPLTLRSLGIAIGLFWLGIGIFFGIVFVVHAIRSSNFDLGKMEARGMRSMLALRKDCAAIKEDDIRAMSGVYQIAPFGTDCPSCWQEVYCDMDTLGGGWTVFQRRVNGDEKFDRDWFDYKKGFGNASSEYWLGNEGLNALTSGEEAQDLQMEFQEWGRDCKLDALYSGFRVGNEREKFRLTLERFLGGSAGDSMMSNSRPWRIPNGQPFTTNDVDNDNWPEDNCASEPQGRGGWWHNKCSGVIVNGKYYTEPCSDVNGIIYEAAHDVYYPFQGSEMKLRRSNFGLRNNDNKSCPFTQSTCRCTSPFGTC